MSAVTRPFPPPLAATRWTLDASTSSVEFSVRQFWGLSTVHGRSARSEGELEFGDLVAIVEGGDDRVELAAEANVDARELGMTWSPVGNLRTPVAVEVLTCLRRAA